MYDIHRDVNPFLRERTATIRIFMSFLPVEVSILSSCTALERCTANKLRQWIRKFLPTLFFFFTVMHGIFLPPNINIETLRPSSASRFQWTVAARFLAILSNVSDAFAVKLRHSRYRRDAFPVEQTLLAS